MKYYIYMKLDNNKFKDFEEFREEFKWYSFEFGFFKEKETGYEFFIDDLVLYR